MQTIFRGVSSNGIDRYLGIPYGQAVGEFGPFGAVTAVPAWTGERDCTAPPAVFPQPVSRLAPIMGPAIDAHRQSDQAFTVNVFVPQGAQRLPVLVFVHGGAFMTGGGGPRWYDGTAFARRANAVVVTINYRLGIWGNLVAEGAPANNAVRDVLAALQWVAANIDAFGGDAGNVTLSGQSAGATMTRLMTLCRDAEGVFRRAILLSCPGRIGASVDEAAATTARVMALAGSTDLHALTAVPPENLVALSSAVAREIAVLGVVQPMFRPYTDGHLLQTWMDDPVQAAGKAHCRDVMIGYAREEMAAFLWQQAEAIDRDASRVIDWYRSSYGSAGLGRYRHAACRRSLATPYTQWVDGLSDQMFAHPALDFAAAYGAHGTAYVYRFDLQTRQPHLHAPHCLDLPFLFDNVDDWYDAPMLEGLPGDMLHELAARFANQIAHYVRDGRPDAEAWRPYTDATPCVMPFDRT